MTQPAMDLAAYLDDLRQYVDAALDRTLHARPAPRLIVEAMRYALLGAGKRLRPCLTLASAEAVAETAGIDSRTARLLALPSACAVELVHAYSLVHDDLPAMDDDALRRGRPTTHVVYGDGIAILAGDGLLTEAFAVLAEAPMGPPGTPDAPPARRLRALATLALAAGAAGMVGGQAIDLAAAGRVRPGQASDAPLDRAGLEDMHARKTGALIRAAATMGALMVGADDRTVAAVDTYARELGLAFQIIDDVLDVVGSDEQLGKAAGKDAVAGKLTYPALYGLEASQRLAADGITRAKTALSGAGIGGRLGEIADWSLARRR